MSAWCGRTLILSSNIDVESQLDGKLSLAETYRNVPELRMSWYRSAASDHEKVAHDALSGVH
jgi:hypothetical protein